MTVQRGQLHWADFGVPKGSGPGFRRPVVIVSSDAFNRSLIATVVVAVLTSNTRLARMPGNVLVSASESGLDKDSVVNVTQLATIDREVLDGPIGDLPQYLVAELDAGLRLSLAV